MPYFVKQSVCLFLAIEVLFASTGFAMHEHWCVSMDIKTVSLLHKQGCQKETENFKSTENETSFKRSKCCLDKVTFYKIQTPSSDLGSPRCLSQFLEGVYFFTPVYFPSTGWFHRVVSSNVSRFYSSAPPLHGRSMLIFIQSFLI
ncbi:HYC_CC_PP family protein [Runella sp.]|uniref:HYC_CC_PP family protein n=1 Tax=Runella sp. TaxID=1960881 RepID=UPI003D14C834